MEPDTKAWKAFKEIQAKKSAFLDPDFPFEKAMKAEDPFFENLLWTRYSSKASGMLSEISPIDIKQGDVGDCYFISALAAVAQFPDRIKRLFLTPSLNTAVGAYVLRVWANGEEQHILLDDCIPENPVTGKPAFSISSSGQLWVPLLEKAWAKMNGNYANIVKGTPAEAMRFLTGAPTDHIEHSEFSENQIWEELQTALREGHIVCSSSGNVAGVVRDHAGVGLKADHGYSLLSALHVNLPKGQGEKLLLLKDPHGFTDWRGNWSQKSPLWSPSVISQIPGSTVPTEKGKFYISVSDYLHYFRATYICRVNDSNVHSSLKMKIPEANVGALVEFKISSETRGVFSITQIAQRFERISQPLYTPRKVFVLLGKLTSTTEASYISGALGRYEDVSIFPQKPLEAGNYVLYFEMDKTNPKQNVDQCTIQCYASKKIDLQAKAATAESASLFLHSILKSCAKALSAPKDYAEHGDAGIKRYSAINDSKAGFGYYYYINETLDKNFYENVFFSKIQGVTLKQTPYTKNIIKPNEFEVNLPPGKDCLIILKKTGMDSQVSIRQKISITQSAGVRPQEEIKNVGNGSSSLKVFQEKGRKKQIAPADLYIYDINSLKDTGEIRLLFENTSKAKTYDINFDFVLKNLKFTDSDPKFKIKLGPGATAEKTMKSIKPGSGESYTYKCSSAEVKIPIKKEVKKIAGKKIAGKKMSAFRAKQDIEEVIDLYGNL